MLDEACVTGMDLQTALMTERIEKVVTNVKEKTVKNCFQYFFKLFKERAVIQLNAI